MRSATPEDEVDELDKEFLPVINVVSSEKRTTSSNISNDEFDLEEDSRQLSIDQSYPASHHSDIGNFPTNISTGFVNKYCYTSNTFLIHSYRFILYR